MSCFLTSNININNNNNNNKILLHTKRQ